MTRLRDGIRTARKHKIALSNIGLVLLLIIGGSYLLLSVMRVNPVRSTYTVTVLMDTSGGLQPNNDVTLRGFRIGTVKAVNLTPTGVAATAEIDSNYQIPTEGAVAVNALSAAGEQYIDFRPTRNDGPYLHDGSKVTNGVSTPLPVTAVLTDSSLLIDQIDPAKLQVVVTELNKAFAGGPDQLKSIITGLSVASAGLDGLLPQTTNLLANLRTIAATTSHAQPDLATLTRNSRVLFDQATAADAELRKLLEHGPGEVGALTSALNTTQDPLTRVVHDFAAITRAAQLRTPALQALFPALASGTAALGVPTHDGAFNAMADIFPRPYCDYAGPVAPPNVITNQGRVPLWRYCDSTNPAVQVRGAANAPRPNVPNNGAQMPPGVDPNQLSSPLPDHSTW